MVGYQDDPGPRDSSYGGILDIDTPHGHVSFRFGGKE
jgi:hypothetical protein